MKVLLQIKRKSVQLPLTNYSVKVSWMKSTLASNVHFTTPIYTPCLQQSAELEGRGFLFIQQISTEQQQCVRPWVGAEDRE